MSKLLRYIWKFISLPGRERLLFFEALFFLYLAKGMLVIFPFRLCIKTVKPSREQHDAGIGRLKEIKYAIGRANRLAFWKNVCLVQSFAARWMLTRRGIKSELFIGVSQDEQKKLTAHAWLVVDNLEIVSQGGNYNKIFSV
jgi:hypothetical protein